MKELTVKHNGKLYVGMTPDKLAEHGIPQDKIGAACKMQAQADISSVADTYRGRLASTSAAKLVEYRIKEEIARDPANAHTGELALLDREAAARGIDRPALIEIISYKAAAYRKIALLIGVIEAEASAAINAISDNAEDLEAQIAIALAQAKMQADAAFVEALAMLGE